ncbi:MAG: hypothetical protein GHCLOJNM_04154 [bacterium]|nr:hypothetical protein [bacterium]
MSTILPTPLHQEIACPKVRLAIRSVLLLILCGLPGPNPAWAQAVQTLLEISSTIPEQSHQFSGGSRQVVNYGPIAVPRSGRLRFIVTSTPNIRQEVENLERHDSTVQTISFNGQQISLRPDYPDCNPPGSNPAICSSIWDPPTGGSLTVELLGPAVYNIFGEFVGHVAQNYTLQVLFQPGPDVTQVEPNTGSAAGWDPVTVRGDYFAENAVVLFGGTAATETIRVSAQEILCRVPAGVPGATDVLVLNPDPELAPWNFGRPYGLFGELPGGFTYVSPGPPPALEVEELQTTYSGVFPAQRSFVFDGHQQFAEFDFSIPGPGQLRWEAWAFLPILNPVFGPPGDPHNFEAFNDSSAVRGFVRGDAQVAPTNVFCTSLTYLYGPVICNSTQIVDAAGAGAGHFTLSGPASFSALDFSFLGAPRQDWTLALWFAHQPVVTQVEPAMGSPLGGTPVTVHGAHFGTGARVRFGNTAATGVAIVDENTIQCVSPPGGPGAVNVSVVVLTNLAGTLENGFEYGEPEPTPSPTQDFDEVDDQKINAQDLLALLIRILNDEYFRQILFDFARQWGKNVD